MTDPEKYQEAVAIVRLTGQASVTLLQQHGFSYGDATRSIEAMESAGLVTAPLATGRRKVLKPKKTCTPEELLRSG